MKQCPYAATLLIDDMFIDVRCERRFSIFTAGWHLHSAPLPEEVRAHPGIKVRWRSSSAPDHYTHD